MRWTSVSSEASPVTAVGRVCGTSASSAPSVSTICTRSSRAMPVRSSQKVRHRNDGSEPCTITRSRSAPGTRAAWIVGAGHSTTLLSPSLSRIVGRTEVKS
jgi:hypothetical protein